ncbi:hypothetical protein [Nocardia abscessus]|uniref:hypothetical protein n=1 Tax=Nocardia abscessus TaxID=120957 RepID=UPI0024571F29|nr:hypothetical protein [Nocardia abscessus]
MFRRKRAMVYGVYEVVAACALGTTQTYAVNAIGFDDAALQVLRVTGCPTRALVSVRFIQEIG